MSLNDLPNRKFKISVLSIILIVNIGLDQWTKSLAIDHLKGKPGVFFFDNIIRFIYAENTGAWGNLGGNWPEPYKSFFLIGLPIVVLFGVAGHIIFNSKVRELECFGMSLILSGGIGNLIDRILFGHVVDFLWIGFSNSWLQTNIFNIADVVIMIGFFLLITVHLRDAYLERKDLPNSAE